MFIDGYITLKKGVHRLTGSSVSHIGFLLVILLFILYQQQGVIFLMIIPHEVKQKPFEYLILGIVLLIGVLLYFFGPFDSYGRRVVVYCMTANYFLESFTSLSPWRS